MEALQPNLSSGPPCETFLLPKLLPLALLKTICDENKKDNWKEVNLDFWEIDPEMFKVILPYLN